MNMGLINYTITETGGETVFLAEYDGCLCICDWISSPRHDEIVRRTVRLLDTEMTQGTSPVLMTAAEMIGEYLAGTRREFDLPLLTVGTDFQKAVWQALTTIPYGETCSYASVARATGRPEAVRAVARAIGGNPLSIFIPCHRVVGADGRLTGYAGGLPLKKRLLEIERQSQM